MDILKKGFINSKQISGNYLEAAESAARMATAYLPDIEDIPGITRLDGKMPDGPQNSAPAHQPPAL